MEVSVHHATPFLLEFQQQLLNVKVAVQLKTFILEQLSVFTVLMLLSQLELLLMEGVLAKLAFSGMPFQPNASVIG